MNGKLLRALIDKKFFTEGLEVDAAYRGRDLSGALIVGAQATFTVLTYRYFGKEEVAIEGSNVIDGSRKVFYAQSLRKIDGMDPLRFAASCGIDPEGEKIKEGKRRGRKPKNRLVEPEPVAIDEFDDEDEDDVALEAIFA